MALSSAVIRSWNPFAVTGTPMPANLLLMCKILVVAVLCTGHIGIMPDPFLPFIPGVDALEPQLFRRILQATAVIAALALLFNRAVRASALILGGCFLLAVLSSKAYYGNNKTFVGLLLVLAGLSDFDRPPYLLRWQFSLVYFGAALNKLLLPDWQSGVFFDYWATTKVKQPVFIAVRDWLPPLLAGKIMCWTSITIEFAVALGLLVKRFVPAALWLNALFQVGLLEFTGGTFTLFFYAMQAAALPFIDWPPAVDRSRPATVTGFCARLVCSSTFWLTATALLSLPELRIWRDLIPIDSSLWRRLLVFLGLTITVLASIPRSGRSPDSSAQTTNELAKSA